MLTKWSWPLFPLVIIHQKTSIGRAVSWSVTVVNSNNLWNIYYNLEIVANSSPFSCYAGYHINQKYLQFEFRNRSWWIPHPTPLARSFQLILEQLNKLQVTLELRKLINVLKKFASLSYQISWLVIISHSYNWFCWGVARCLPALVGLNYCNSAYVKVCVIGKWMYMIWVTYLTTISWEYNLTDLSSFNI